MALRAIFIKSNMRNKPHTVPPTDPRIAFGAQPAEAELTDDDIRKFDLFTQAEIDSMLPWEMQMIRDTPYEEVKRIMDELRRLQGEQRRPKKV